MIHNMAIATKHIKNNQFIHIHPTGNFSMASQEVLYELKEGEIINSGNFSDFNIKDKKADEYK